MSYTISVLSLILVMHICETMTDCPPILTQPTVPPRTFIESPLSYSDLACISHTFIKQQMDTNDRQNRTHHNHHPRQYRYSRILPPLRPPHAPRAPSKGVCLPSEGIGLVDEQVEALASL